MRSTKRYYFIPILVWPKYGTLRTANAGEDVEQLELSLIVRRNVNGTTTWKTV